MVDMQLSSPSYLKHAFKDQHNLVVLLGAACFSVAFASPVPLLVGAGGELLWLLVGPRLPAFRDWVDRQLSAQYLARAETAIEGALSQLSEAEATRFLSLSAKVAELGPLAAERLSSREQQLGQHGLLELRRTFLDYLFLGQRVASLRESTPNAEIEKEAAQLQESYTAERELTVRMTIRKALGAVQRRMSQQTALAGVERSIELRLEMLEKALPYLRGRLADPGLLQLAPELDTALAEVGSAESLELTVDEILDGPGPSATP
jgi:hypothetical protein